MLEESSCLKWRCSSILGPCSRVRRKWSSRFIYGSVRLLLHCRNWTSLLWQRQNWANNLSFSKPVRWIWHKNSKRHALFLPSKKRYCSVAVASFREALPNYGFWLWDSNILKCRHVRHVTGLGPVKFSWSQKWITKPNYAEHNLFWLARLIDCGSSVRKEGEVSTSRQGQLSDILWYFISYNYTLGYFQ